MALPIVRNLAECADFDITVLPFLDQLRPLPRLMAESMSSPAALQQIYLHTNPLVSAVTLALALAPLFLLVSEVNRNYSQVDRAWSILPSVFNLHFAIYAHVSGIETWRLHVLVAINTIWSTRLTYNYFRKGGYSVGSEDYRWKIVQAHIGPTLFFLLNVVFISLAQCLLLVAICTPTYVILQAQRLVGHSGGPPAWDWTDTGVCVILLISIAVSFVADQQQWDYHQAKSTYLKTAKVPAGRHQADLERGFLSNGLFAYSRHPNFAAEQNVWVTMYLWSCIVTQTWWNWSIIGAASYLCLFQGSTWLTELLSAGKYPEYRVYQQQVGKFLPIPGASPPTFPDSVASAANGTLLPAKDAAMSRQRYDLR